VAVMDDPIVTAPARSPQSDPAQTRPGTIHSLIDWLQLARRFSHER
jgi:hypothetical protein